MVENKPPFSQEDLNEIFKISPTYTDRVISRESSTLEFKETFGWASLAKYMKTSVSFANNKGGYIVFGIKNKPHTLKGLSGNALNKFEAIDPEQISNHFNSHFSPEIIWDMHQHELKNKVYGLIYIFESLNKPVLCCKSAGDELKEGDIYYRYRGRSERIKYPELRAILESKRENEQKLWMQHLSNIARIGVQETGIFDLQTGSVTGSGSSFLIDESLLSQLAFIKEGEFSEVKGKPTLKLIGRVETVGGATIGITKKQIVKTKGIRTSDIVLGALNQGNVPEPEEFIKQICYESTAFLPVYYFIKKSGIKLTKIIEMLEGLVSRSATRTRLIERLKNRKTQELSIPAGKSTSAKEKRKYANNLRNENVDSSLSGKELRYCLQAIRGISIDDIKSNSKYIRELLRTWFNGHYATAESTLADNLRRTICWVDEALNMGDCK